MSYQMYHTDALILRTRSSGEHDRVITLLTHDFGRITARAISLRKETSKLRYALQPYMFSRVALVRGRHWRITGAHVCTPIHHFQERRRRHIAMRICALLERLVAGEEPCPDLFLGLAHSFEVLASLQLSDDELLTMESLMVLHVCTSLGYGPKDPHIAPYGYASHIDHKLIVRASMDRAPIIAHINAALSQSHL